MCGLWSGTPTQGQRESGKDGLIFQMYNKSGEEEGERMKAGGAGGGWSPPPPPHLLLLCCVPVRTPVNDVNSRGHLLPTGPPARQSPVNHRQGVRGKSPHPPFFPLFVGSSSITVARYRPKRKHFRNSVFIFQRRNTVFKFKLGKIQKMENGFLHPKCSAVRGRGSGEQQNRAPRSGPRARYSAPLPQSPRPLRFLRYQIN